MAKAATTHGLRYRKPGAKKWNSVESFSVYEKSIGLQEIDIDNLALANDLQGEYEIEYNGEVVRVEIVKRIEVVYESIIQ